eukprot:TRINITY_DN11352_c0_g1_i4.p2 TRINITY_DN11352_c0_g1~~TRINITY_DN11352_c0_g1_i4.p2  ORF type:complete len:250 (+),score=36.15 TRINITY_DN11352_c0_g1_i4:2396-3145(+)
MLMRIKSNLKMENDQAVSRAFERAVSSFSAPAESFDNVQQHEPVMKEYMSAPKHQWQVGELCQAVWQVDNKVYNAEILAIDEQTRRCQIRFVNFGNEEDVFADDLLPAESIDTSSYDQPAIPERMTVDNAESLRKTKAWQTGEVAAYRLGEATIDGTIIRIDEHSKCSLECVNGVILSQIALTDLIAPTAHPGAAKRNPTIANSSVPIASLPSTLPTDDEATANMLMAWYNSGFHTGFYQAQKAFLSTQ